MLSCLRRLTKFRRDERGSPVMEFVFAAPVLFTMTVGTIEFGMVMFVNILMESSLRDAARYSITGREPSGVSREQHIIDIIADRTIGLVDVDAAQISILTYPTFDDIGKAEDYVDGNGNGQYDGGETYDDANGNGEWDEDRGTDGAGGSGEVAVYRIDYEWEILTPLVMHVIGEDGKFPLRASVAVRNEPWDDE